MTPDRMPRRGSGHALFAWTIVGLVLGSVGAPFLLSAVLAAWALGGLLGLAVLAWGLAPRSVLRALSAMAPAVRHPRRVPDSVAALWTSFGDRPAGIAAAATGLASGTAAGWIAMGYRVP